MSNWVSKITIVLTLCAVAAHIGRSGAPARRTAHTDQLQCPAEDSAPECSASLSDATSNAFSNTAAATRRSISRDVNADCSEDQFRFWLPAGGSVVLGSLDKTAGQHSLKVTWRPALAEARNTSDAANFMPSLHTGTSRSFRRHPSCNQNAAIRRIRQNCPV